MWKMQLSAVIIQPSIRTYVLEEALKHAGHPLVPLIPVMATRNLMEFVSKMPVLQQCSEIAIRGQ